MMQNNYFPKPVCIECNQNGHNISEYKVAVLDELEYDEEIPSGNELREAVDNYIRREEGTYNRNNGHFWCTECYCKLNCPLGVAP